MPNLFEKMGQTQCKRRKVEKNSREIILQTISTRSSSNQISTSLWATIASFLDKHDRLFSFPCVARVNFSACQLSWSWPTELSLPKCRIFPEWDPRSKITRPSTSLLAHTKQVSSIRISPTFEHVSIASQCSNLTQLKLSRYSEQEEFDKSTFKTAFATLDLSVAQRLICLDFSDDDRTVGSTPYGHIQNDFFVMSETMAFISQYCTNLVVLKLVQPGVTNIGGIQNCEAYSTLTRLETLSTFLNHGDPNSLPQSITNLHLRSVPSFGLVGIAHRLDNLKTLQIDTIPLQKHDTKDSYTVLYEFDKLEHLSIGCFKSTHSNYAGHYERYEILLRVDMLPESLQSLEMPEDCFSDDVSNEEFLPKLTRLVIGRANSSLFVRFHGPIILFPKLQKLTIRHESFGLLLRDIIQAYPNLVRLHVNLEWMNPVDIYSLEEAQQLEYLYLQDCKFICEYICHSDLVKTVLKMKSLTSCRVQGLQLPESDWYSDGWNSWHYFKR